MSSHRRTLAAAVASAAASVSLYPIFTGGVWFLAGLGAIVVVAAAGTATRWRRLPEPVCLAAGLVALLLYLNLVFAHSRSLLHLLPTPASARLLAHLVDQGFADAGKYAPPVPELAPMVLLAAGGIGIAALLTDWMAVRLGSAALAGLPLLLLFTEPFTLSVGRGFFGTTVAFCVGIAGYLGLLSSEGKDRIREWESQDPSARDAPDTKALAAAGRRVGFASVIVALILPLVVPGLHVTRLFGGGQPGIGGHGGAGASSGGAGGVGFPGVDTQFSQQLSSELTTPSQIVLGYNTAVTSPDYLQLYVLDKLTAFRLVAVQPAGSDGASRPAAAGAARAHGRVTGRRGEHDDHHRPRRRTRRPERAADALPHDHGQGQGRPACRPVDAHAVRSGASPRRPVLRRHQPRQLPLGAGPRHRAAAARGDQRPLPERPHLLRLAARPGRVDRRQGGGEDPVREGGGAAGLAGQRDISSTR